MFEVSKHFSIFLMKTISISILILIFSYNILAQYESIELIQLSGQRIDNPVKVNVKQNDNKVVFTATNRSFYIYTLLLEITYVSNLSPHGLKRSFKLHPGDNQLIVFNKIDNDEPMDFKYSYKYNIGFPSNNIDKSFSYIFPFRSAHALEKDGINYINEFKLERSDTIYNMRKGFVVAVPNMFHNADRISRNASVEVMHSDGSIMIYENIDPENTFIDPGKMIYPSQPIGLISQEQKLKIVLCFFKKNGNIEQIPINYHTSLYKGYRFKDLNPDIKINYPEELLFTEMSRREIRKYKKGKLF